MIRKLIRQGQNSFTLTLPNAWIQDTNLKAGDEIDIKLQGKNLVLSTKNRVHVKECTLNIKDYNVDTVRYLLYTAYRTGIGTLTLQFDNPKIISKIEIIASTHFIGFEVTKISAVSLTLECISEPELEKFDSLLRKLFLMVEESINLILQSADTSHIAALTDRYRQIDNFCRRYLYIHRVEEATSYTALFTHLLMLQTDLLWFSKVKKKVDISQWALFKECFMRCTNAFFTQDRDELSVLNEQMRKTLYTHIIPKLGKKDPISEHYLTQELRILYSTIVAMFSVLLQQDLAKHNK